MNSDTHHAADRSAPSSKRRSLLRATGGLGAAAALSGLASSSAAAASTSLESNYDTVVDLRAAGADPTGGDSIVPLLYEHAGDDTLIELPEGTYRMGRQFRHTGFSNFGIVGANATVVPDDYWGFDGIACFLLGTYYDPGTDLHVEGVTVDYSRKYTGVRAIQAQVSDGLTVKDVDVVGVHDSGNWGPALFDVTGSSGTGVVEGFRAPGGGEYTANTPGSVMCGPIGSLTSRYHHGELTYRHCELSNFPNNGIYAGNAGGPVNVVGGYFANNDVAGLRIGGDNSSIRWAQVVVEHNRPASVNQVGVRLDEGKNLLLDGSTISLDSPTGDAVVVHDGVDSATVSNTDVSLSGRPVRGIYVMPGAGPIDLTDVTVEANVSSNALFLSSRSTGGGDVTATRLSVAGDGAGAPYRNAIRCERDGSTFVDLDVEQPGSDYRRALGVEADDCTVRGGTYEATHHPIVNSGAGTTVEDVSLADSYGGYAAVKLYPGSRGVTLSHSRLVGGYLNTADAPVTASGIVTQ